MFEISQRRYLGNKNSILPFIDKIIKQEIGHFNSFCDIFSGTGVVGNYFNTKDNEIISNDLLYHNFISLNAFLNKDSFNKTKLLEIIETFNKIKDKKENYFSKNFGDKYFSKYNAIKMGYIRQQIRKLFMENKINLKEKFILLTSLNYSIDKIANTVGHYDAYIKKGIKNVDFKMSIINTDNKNNAKNKIYNQDANTLIRDIKCDILYLDPPYNSRQYSDAYHLLENISLWQKPDVFGVARKFDRSKIKSDYSKVSASFMLNDLIKNARCKYVLLSCSNMKNGRSNAKISDYEIIENLSKRDKVKSPKQNYKEFNVGKEKRNYNNILYTKDTMMAS